MLSQGGGQRQPPRRREPGCRLSLRSRMPRTQQCMHHHVADDSIRRWRVSVPLSKSKRVLFQNDLF